MLFEDWSDGIVKLRESRAMHTNHAGYQFLEGSPGTIGVRIAYWRALKDYGGSSVSSLEAALQVSSGIFERQSELSAKYFELLYAVESKHPGESRHETALRYIRQAERTGEAQCQKST